jgi:hypothetical protein
MAGDFQRFIEQLLQDQFGGKKDRLAKAIGISGSAFWRQVSERDTLGLVACLRLARVAGVSPRRVLELAHKQEEADEIERVYGPEQPPLSDVDHHLLALPLDVKRGLLHTVEALDAARRRAHGPPGTSAARGRRASTG